MIDKLGWKIKQKKGKINIVTGAGISMSAGLPGGLELNENILQSISKPWCKVASYKRIASSIPLETIFQALADHNLEEVIQEVIQNLDSPNITCTHQAINYFAQNNQIENIITFNFDRIHEKSFKKFENIVNENFGKTVIKRYKNEKDILLNLIKLHGTCEQEGIIIFSEYITGFSIEIQQLVEELFENKFVLILGYGGWDYDFTQILKLSISQKKVPKEIIWLDRNFPKSGGRTDLINLFKHNGTKVQAIKMDFEQYFSESFASQFEKEYKFDYSQILNKIENISLETKKKILIQLSFQQSDLDITNEILINAKKTQLSSKYYFFEGLLYERKGNNKKAISFFKEALYDDSTVEQKILSSHKVFRLSDGKNRLFKNIQYNIIPTELIEYVKFLEYSIVTDKDGLDRDFALKTCNTLPPIKNFIQQLKSTDWIKILIKVYAELARLNYESKKYNNAFQYDLSSVELARTLSDPEYLKSTIGNLGVSYMGLAYISKNKKSEFDKWNNAKKHLSESLTYSENFSQFHHALFEGDLGIVEYYLGNTDKAIDLIRKSANKLKIIYPNYSIYFFGKLCTVLVSKAKDMNNARLIKDAQKAIIEGVNLMLILNEFDDIELIIEGINEIEKCNFKIENEKYEVAKNKAINLNMGKNKATNKGYT